jgi:hypothetical protein
MAAKVKDETITFGTGSGSKYDWDSWFDGGTWVLERGTDFATEVDTFQTTVLIRARKRGIKVLTKKVGGDRLAIRQVGPRA